MAFVREIGVSVAIGVIPLRQIQHLLSLLQLIPPTLKCNHFPLNRERKSLLHVVTNLGENLGQCVRDGIGDGSLLLTWHLSEGTMPSIVCKPQERARRAER